MWRITDWSHPRKDGDFSIIYGIKWIQITAWFYFLFWLTNLKWIVSCLLSQQCELVAQDVLPTFQRNKIVDLTANWVFDNVAFLIPVPVETANMNAVVKPFQWPVRKNTNLWLLIFIKTKHSLFNQQIWVGLGVSMVCVIVVLSLIQRYLEYQTAGPLTNDGGLRVVRKTKTGKQYLYVFGNLLSQG